MKQSFILFCCLLFGLVDLPGQSVRDSLHTPNAVRYRRIAGLNMTPLITKLVPFNRSSPNEAGPFLLRFKRYGQRNRSAFRLSMGVHLIPDASGEIADPQISLALGWERRRSLSRHWGFTKGFDFMFLGGDLNIPGVADTEDVTIGLGPLWGIEYFFDQRMSLGIEAVLVVGFSSSEVVVVNILPPVGIFLNHYF